MSAQGQICGCLDTGPPRRHLSETSVDLPRAFGGARGSCRFCMQFFWTPDCNQSISANERTMSVARCRW
eukprot:11011281-Lingulodinium_polyedra.AAC.1